MGACRCWVGWVLWLLAAPLAWAGQYVLLAGQANTVPVAARVFNGEPLCNLEITVQGQLPFQREVRAPHFETRIVITPQDEDSITVSWRGQFKRDQDRLVNACPTQGQTQFAVVDSQAPTRAQWAAVWAQLSPEKASCMRSALGYHGIRTEWFDLTSTQASAEDWKIQRAFLGCDAFVAQKKAWGSLNPQGHACTLPGGLKTRCEGYYSATVNGQTQAISRDQAIVRMLENQPWGTGVRELASAKSARLKKEQDRLAQLAAEEQAKIQAEEDARLLAEKQVQEAKDAEVRARQAKIDALRAQIAEEKARKEKERLENRNWVLKQIDKIKGESKAAPKPDDQSPSKDAKTGAAATPDKPEASAPVAPAAPAAPALPSASAPEKPAPK